VGVHANKDEKSSGSAIVLVMAGQPRMYWASVTSRIAWAGVRVRIVAHTQERAPLPKRVVFWWRHMRSTTSSLVDGGRRSGSEESACSARWNLRTCAPNMISSLLRKDLQNQETDLIRVLIGDALSYMTVGPIHATQYK
jgi:hypothetical protein